MEFSKEEPKREEQLKLVKVYYLKDKIGRWPTEQEVEACEDVPEEHKCKPEAFDEVWTYQYGMF